ncbi:nicotinate-nicotinamide nucleotide adenylyltransferase [Candidatus Parcubacteria bacterium]|nr:nicotinate-nicotinamide nucleotide adenylyltransferase [Candidatus Parcubacteria bacterium]
MLILKDFLNIFKCENWKLSTMLKVGMGRTEMNKNKQRVVIYGGSFNPPCRHHAQITETLIKIFDVVIIVPCGKRQDKDSANILALNHRKELARIAFKKMPKVKIDYHDMENNVYTPTYYLQEKYEKLYPDAEIWHDIGTDLVIGGSEENSEIQSGWTHGKMIWKILNWVVIYRPGYEITKEDMPPKAMFIKIPNIFGSGTMVRERLAGGKCVKSLVIPEVEQYVKKYDLYKK